MYLCDIVCVVDSSQSLLNVCCIIDHTLLSRHKARHSVVEIVVKLDVNPNSGHNHAANNKYCSEVSSQKK